MIIPSQDSDIRIENHDHWILQAAGQANILR